MEIKTLSLKDKKEPEEIIFDEYMMGGGTWSESKANYKDRLLVKLLISDSKYTYFLAEGNQRDQILLRNKK